MSDWFLDNFGWILLGVIVLLVAALVALAKASAEQRSAFMAECTQYQKQYECTALWRAGESKSRTVVVPVVTR